MRIFTYIPENKHTGEMISHLNRELPEPDFELIQEPKSADFLDNLEAYDYDALIVYNDPASQGLLKSLSSKKLKGPLLCSIGYCLEAFQDDIDAPSPTGPVIENF